MNTKLRQFVLTQNAAIILTLSAGQVRHEALIDREVVRDRLPRAVAAAREKLWAARAGERR